MSSPKEVVEEIRKTRFLIGLSTEDSSDDVKSALEDKKKFLEDASRLAGDIHTMQPRFILELIQNADDNHYAAGVEPKLKFTIRSSELVVQNNEKGFNKENVEALCGIGGTTKKRALGYIGEKGIGFKSVFLVTDEPHIYSNGFQFKFKRDDRYPVSMIIPEWVEEVPDFVDTGLTNIVLPPKPEAESEIGQHISEIRPSLLLFLRKLRTIEIEDENQHKLETIRRHDHGAQVDITHGAKTSHWRVVRKQLEKPDQLIEERRRDIRETEVVLAFPIAEDGTADTSDEQSLFAFLPVREYGFKFIIQADFILPVSREDIIKDNEWNKWLRNSIVTVFLYAVNEFKTDRKLGCTFYDYLPFEEVSDDFFLPVVRDTYEALQNTESILTEAHLWRKPSDVLMADEEVRKLVANEDLKALVGKEYISTEVRARKPIRQKLGVKEFSIRTLMKCLRKGKWVKRQSKEWFAFLYEYLSNQELSEDVLGQLRRFNIIRLENDKLTSIDDGAIFFPLHKKAKQYGFEGELRIIDRDIIDIISTREKQENHRTISQLLERLGIQSPSPYEIIENHILPYYKTGEWQDKDSASLMGHIGYIKDNLEAYEKESDANKDWSEEEDPLRRLKQSLRIRIDTGAEGPDCYDYPANTYVSGIYGNRNGLETLFEGIDVRFVHACYIEDIVKDFEGRIDRIKGKLAGKSSKWKRQHKKKVQRIREEVRKLEKERNDRVKEWRELFVAMGASEGLIVKRDPGTAIYEGRWYANNAVTHKRVGKWQRPGTVWKDEEWNDTEWAYYIGDDWVCRDFERIVEKLDSLNGEKRIEVAKKLCDLVARSWTKYKKYQWCNYYYRCSGQHGWSEDTTRSTFLLRMVDTPWLPTNQHTLAKPSEVFLDKPEIREVLGDTVPYLAVEVRNQDFAEALGMNTSADVDNALTYLMTLSEQCDEKGNLASMYHFLNKHFDEDEDKIIEAFSDNALILIPNTDQGFFTSHEVLWRDLSDVFGENRGYLEKHYPRLKYFFVERLGISEKPSPKDYADVLIDLSKKLEITKKDFQITMEIYSELDHHLNPDNVETLISAQEWWDEFISEPIFLVDNGVFWSNDGDILIADRPEWRELFETRQEIAFLLLPEGYHPDRIAFFVESTGLRYLSKACKVTPDFDESSRSGLEELGKQVMDYMPYVMRYLYWRENKEYERLKGTGFFDHFTDFQIYAVDELQAQYVVETHDGRTITATGEAPCLLHENALYISRGLEHEMDHIAIEFSKLFGDIKALDDFTICIFEKRTKDKIDRLMSAKGIQELPESEADLLEGIAVPPVGEAGESEESREPWVAESSPEEADIDIEDYEPEEVLVAVLTEEGDDEEYEEREVERGGDAESDGTRLTAEDEQAIPGEDAKAIGRWGEEHALKCLREETSERYRDAQVVETDDGFVVEKDGKILVEVSWLNKYSDRGVGYDIELIERETKHYIEVKSTKLEDKDWFVVTRDQWKLMQQHGDRFSIYRIYRAGTENPRVVRIKDPAGLWRKGAIDAHPIRIRI